MKYKIGDRVVVNWMGVNAPLRIGRVIQIVRNASEPYQIKFDAKYATWPSCATWWVREAHLKPFINLSGETDSLFRGILDEI